MKTRISRDDLIGKTRFTMQFVCQGCVENSEDYWRNYNENLCCEVCGKYNDDTYFRKVDENGKLVRLNEK